MVELFLLWFKVGDCIVIVDFINSSFIACRDVNFGNKFRGLDMLMCLEICLENFCFSVVYINMINDRVIEKFIFKSNLLFFRVFFMVK